jgi:hypothetical protein
MSTNQRYEHACVLDGPVDDGGIIFSEFDHYQIAKNPWPPKR